MRLAGCVSTPLLWRCPRWAYQVSPPLSSPPSPATHFFFQRTSCFVPLSRLCSCARYGVEVGPDMRQNANKNLVYRSVAEEESVVSEARKTHFELFPVERRYQTGA